jgi:hypothetical protein
VSFTWISIRYECRNRRRKQKVTRRKLNESEKSEKGKQQQTRANEIKPNGNESEQGGAISSNEQNNYEKLL